MHFIPASCWQDTHMPGQIRFSTVLCSAQHNRPLDYYEEKMTPLLSKLNTSEISMGLMYNCRPRREQERCVAEHIWCRDYTWKLSWELKSDISPASFPVNFYQLSKTENDLQITRWDEVLWITLQHSLHFKQWFLMLFSFNFNELYK